MNMGVQVEVMNAAVFFINRGFKQQCRRLPSKKISKNRHRGTVFMMTTTFFNYY